MELRIETGEANTFLTAVLDKDDEIDEFDYGMIKNNSISGLLPVVYVDVNDNRKLKYNITSTVSLQRFLTNEIDRRTFLAMLKCFQKSFLELKEYMMLPEYILLEYNNIFVKPSNGEICLVCIPIISNAKKQNVEVFFKDLLFHAKYKKNEDNTYVAELINFLSMERVFSLEEFGKRLDEIIMGNNRSNYQGSYVFQRAQSGKFDSSSGNVENKENQKRSDEAENGRFNKPVNLSMGFRIPGMDNPPVADMNNSKKNDSSKKGFSLFGKKTKQENILPVIKENHNLKDKNLDNDLEILKGYKNNGKGQLVPCDGRKGSDALPYIIRISNKEKIEIKGEVFRLGRGKNYTSYCIDNNPSVGRNHADIIRHGQEYQIIDNNSKNHTYVDGQQIASEFPVALKQGTKIRLADEEFVFYLY